MTRRDTYAAVTDRIIAALEQGVIPWRQPWAVGAPRNAITDRPYRGLNPIVLALAANERHYSDPRWLTYKQAQNRGGNVRRGEHGETVFFWKWIEREEGDEVRRFPMLRVFTVFNVEQCDDIQIQQLARTEFDPIAEAERIIDGYADGPTLEHGGHRAAYSPSLDRVTMPAPEAFVDESAYYAVAFHELTHSTGHPSRLKRAGMTEAAPFGSDSYSREELVAEFGDR